MSAELADGLLIRIGSREDAERMRMMMGELEGALRTPSACPCKAFVGPVYPRASFPKNIVIWGKGPWQTQAP